MKKLASLILLSAISLSIMHCEYEKSDKAESRSLISFHTSGMISRESAIKVIFYENLIPGDEIGQTLAESPFDISPDIAGKVKWINARTLEFRPEKQMPGGEKYEVKLDLSQIAETFYNYSDFSFNFSTKNITIPSELSFS